MRYLKDYKIFENVDTSNTIVECLIYIFDKYNIPENGPDFIPSDEDENIFYAEIINLINSIFFPLL